jgi:hypothetical protein
VLCMLLNTPPFTPTLPGLTVKAEDITTDTTKVDFCLVMYPKEGGGLDGLVEYRSELLDAATIVRWVGDYLQLLGQVGQDSERPLSEYTLSAAQA